MILDTDHFQRLFTSKSVYLKELDDEYLDTSLATKGLTIIYRDSRYKKKIRVLVNAGMVVNDLSNTDKLLHKLDKRIGGYFDHKYTLNNFTLSGVTFTVDIDVGSHEKVLDYLKGIKRVGRVKGFSPVSYDCFDEKASFCLSGNSNDTDFLLYDLEKATIDQLRNADAGRKQLQSVSERIKGILRAEIRLTKPKAIREYADATDTSGQIVEMMKNSTDAFMGTFTRVVPFGDFYKMDAAVEIVRSEVKDSIMRRRMLRLLALIPEKKSLHLAQKEMNCRDVDKVMEAFAQIHLSPVTISKRHEVKHLDNLYSYFLK
ncbi:hypothetical protein [Pseudoflavonifractor sp. 524-17]|uniref:hypothetical protein n=1 Tax=Pseudoflavonifractor sp. 524-17 TaxID=2304577 RepID=UPI00137A9F8D|nr:hypothetical protein [Pseudoflavonifractor sp. 524-17]